MRVSEASLRLLHETNALDRRGAPLTLVGEARASRRGFLARGSPLALAALTRESTEPRYRRSGLETPGVAFTRRSQRSCAFLIFKASGYEKTVVLA